MTTLKVGPNFGPDYASATDYSTVLEGVAQQPIGADLGPVVTGSFTPLVDKDANNGDLPVYIRHNSLNALTDVKVFLSRIGYLSTYAYGGDDSSQDDYDQILSWGSASDVSNNAKNNAEGLSSGLWIDMNRDSNASTRFDISNFDDEVKIFGKLGIGATFGTAIVIHSSAMAKNDGGSEADANAPENGKIGPEGNIVLGESAHIKLRMYIPSAYDGIGGYFQCEFNIIYTETA